MHFQESFNPEPLELPLYNLDQLLFHVFNLLNGQLIEGLEVQLGPLPQQQLQDQRLVAMDGCQHPIQVLARPVVQVCPFGDEIGKEVYSIEVAGSEQRRFPIVRGLVHIRTQLHQVFQYVQMSICCSEYKHGVATVGLKTEEVPLVHGFGHALQLLQVAVLDESEDIIGLPGVFGESLLHSEFFYLHP